jgi:two-component system, OmpR family, sensor histidine kinase CiaH
MPYKKRNLRLALIIYWLILFYFIAALVWWFIELSVQNNLIAQIKLGELQKDNPSYIAAYEAILKEQRSNFFQFIGEGIVFLLFILTGASYLISAFKKEMKATAKQRSFMMAITHELKTPIAISKLNLETIQKHSLNATQLEKLLNNTLQETNRLDTLCNNLLISSQIDEQGYETIKEELDFSDVVNDCYDDFVSRYPLRTFFSHITDNVFIVGDKFLLRMIVNNLLENAIKYSPKEKPISILLNAENDYTTLKIVDEGFGIPDSEKQHVFKKNYRVGNNATKSAKGTGLGLYIASRVAKTHDAKITIETNPIGGSIFIFTQKVIKVAHV